MTIKILDNGTTIKVLYDTRPVHIVKSQVRIVDLIGESIVQLDLGLGAMRMVLLPYKQVVNPALPSAEDLLDAIAQMLNPASKSAIGENDPNQVPPSVGI